MVAVSLTGRIEKEKEDVMYLDYRLSKILSEDRIEQSRTIRDRRLLEQMSNNRTLPGQAGRDIAAFRTRNWAERLWEVLMGITSTGSPRTAGGPIEKRRR